MPKEARQAFFGEEERRDRQDVTIDVDLVLFNRETFRLGDRRIPSPEILERPLVAIPPAEIAPDYVYPETSRTLSQIARSLDPRSAGMHRREDVILAGPVVEWRLLIPFPAPIPSPSPPDHDDP